MITAKYLLFVGRGRDGGRAIESLLRAYALRVHGDGVQIEVVSVEERPDLADEHRVIAAPMILRQLPLPQRRLVGTPDSPQHLGELLGGDPADWHIDGEPR